MKGVLRLKLAWTGALLLLVAGVARGAEESRSAKVILHLPTRVHFQMAGYYAAASQGYFTAEGLDVEIRAGRDRGIAPLPAVLAGQAEYGVGWVELLPARLKGAPIVIVAAIMQQTPATLLVRTDSGISRAAQLAGKRIALTPLPRSLELRAMLAEVGVTPQTATFVEMAPRERPLLEGTVDAQEALVTDPLGDFNLGRVPTRFLQPADMGLDVFYGDCLFTTEHELEKNPERVAAMRRAVLKGWQFALTNTAGAIDALLADLPEAENRGARSRLTDEARVVRNRVRLRFVQIGHLNPERWQRAAEACVALGLAANTERLVGFLYDENDQRGRNWMPWLLGGLAGVVLIAVLVSWVNVKLQRKVAERTRELRDVEDRWRLAVRGINDGIWDSNLLTDEVYLSERCLEMLGFAPGEIRPSRSEWLARVHPEDEAAREAAMQVHIEGKTSHYSAEFRMRGKDGSYKWILSRGQVLFDAEGRPVRGVGSHTDIHARKVAEQALRESEERHRMLFESNPNAVWVFDVETLKFIAVNTAAIRRYGYTREEFLNLRITDVRPLEEVPRFCEEFTHNISLSPEGQGLWRHRLKSGEIIDAEVAGRVLEVAGRRCFISFVRDVTEERRAQAALRESEERSRTLFESAIEGVYESSPQGTFRRVNPAFARMLGYASPAEMLEADRLAEGGLYVQPGRRAHFFAVLGAGNAVIDFESEVRRADGSTMWVSENVRAVRDESGQLLYLQGFASDITARKQAEAALRASEERYRVLFEHSPVAIVEYDYRMIGAWLGDLRASGVTDLERYFEEHPAELANAMRTVVMTEVNEEAVRLLRAPTREHLLEHVDETFTQEANEARRAAVLAVWDGRNEIEGELSLRAFDGTIVRVYYRWWLPLLEGKLSFAWTQVVLVDVTDIKRTEAALAAERERLRVTLRAMNEGVITIDTDGVVQFINEAAGEMTGWTLGAAMGQPIGEVCALRHERTRAPVSLPFMETLTLDRAADLPPHTVILHRQGSFRLVEGRCAPTHDLPGRVLGAVFVFRDVTERSRLESELLRSSKLESVGVLAGGIAHDFNNILTVVMGNLTLAMLDSEVMAAAGKWLREAERGTTRARDLTQQLLTFAKGGEPVRTAVPLPEVVQDAAEFALHGSKVKCEFAIAPDAWPADVDKGQIGQVVQNLVINAVQAMPEGGVIRISLCNETIYAGARPPLTSGNYLRISIADTGSGIRPEHLSRIFDPYFTTKQQGSGLGLATVYSIVRKHQGHIEVESELGRGTTFHIWLPAARIAPPIESNSNTAILTLAGRVLFMDDEEPIRLMAGVLLKRLGLTATVVSDGTEVVDEYTRAIEAGNPFDVVVMDLTVPGGMGGKEAIDELRRIDPRVRAIVSSGYSSDPIMANYRTHGFRARVAKPYRITDLAKALREVIDDVNGSAM